MTNSVLRVRRLSLRYSLAELQRCQDLLRLSRDNIRTAMRHRRNFLRVARVQRLRHGLPVVAPLFPNFDSRAR